MHIWITSYLTKYVDGLPHVISSSEVAVARLSQLRFDVPLKLVRADVKHFFMSGSPDVIVKIIDKATNYELPCILLSTILWTLQNQFVASKWLAGGWHVKIGTGRGLIMSSVISDLCFHEAAERWALQFGVC